MKMKEVVRILLMLFMASMLSIVSVNMVPAIAEFPAFVPFERVSSGKLFYDDFNDGVADGWTVQLGDFKIVNGEYFTQCPVGVESIATVDNLILTDFIVEVKSRLSGIGHMACILFRYTDLEHYYWFHISAEHDRVAFRYLPGEVYLGGVDYPIDTDVNYILKVKVYGYTFTGFLNGEEILSVTDSDYTYASGQVALDARAADAFFDNFKVYRSDTILITNLQAEQKVELYDNNNVLKASDTVTVGETQATLDVSALTFPLEGYFKIYANDGNTLCVYTTPLYTDIWGGDKYIVNLIYDELLSAYNKLKADYESLKSSYDQLQANYTSLKFNYDSLRSDHDKLRTDYNLLRNSHESLKANYESLQAKYADLESKYQVVTGELTYVKNLIYVFIATTIAFTATTVYFASRKPKVEAKN